MDVAITYLTRDIPFKSSKELKRLEKIRKENVVHFENNYNNLLEIEGHSDWTEMFLGEYESDTEWPHFMSNLDSKMRVNLRRKTQKLCANQVSNWNI